MTPQVMCAACQQIFAADAKPSEIVTCPACGYEGAPGGVMRLTGFPSLETFTRSWQKALKHATDETSS